MTTSTKTAPAKKKAPSRAKKDKAKKPKKEEKKETRAGLLTGKQAKVLELLLKGTKTRKELAILTNSQKGWSNLLGAPSKPDSKAGMEGQGWIKQEGRPLTVSITAAGKSILERHKKVVA